MWVKTDWLCKFGKGLDIDGAISALDIAIQVEGESHDCHSSREKRKHGNGTEHIPHLPLPRWIVHIGLVGHGVNGGGPVVFLSDLLGSGEGVCIPVKTEEVTLTLPELDTIER